MSIKERKLQAEIKRWQKLYESSERLITDLNKERLHWEHQNGLLETKIEELEQHIADLRELREFDRIKLERLMGMGV